MLVTRVIGTKIRRRPNTSATMPSTRGWLLSERMRHHEVANLADLVPLGVEDRQADQPGGVHARGAVLTPTTLPVGGPATTERSRAQNRQQWDGVRACGVP